MSQPAADIKVSVIVPMHNAEAHIEACATSLMEQTLREVEYIFVDDGSTDRTAALLKRVIERYPERKPMVRLITHERNKGVGAARLTAFDAARGQYIASVDSDDTVEPQFLSRLYQAVTDTGADIVVSDYTVTKGGVGSTLSNPMPTDPVECIELTMSGGGIFSFWNKLISRRLIEGRNQVLEPGIDMWEDVVAMVRLYLRAQKVAHVAEPLYHYNVHPGSYSLTLSHVTLTQMARSLDLAVNALEKAGLEHRFHSAIGRMRLTLKYNMLLNSRGEQQAEWLDYHREVNRYALTLKSLPMGRRLHLWLGVNGLLPVFNLIADTGRRLHRQ